jgi:hypothetical protein
MVIFFLVRAFFCDDAFSDGDDVKREEEQERFLLLLLVPRGGGRGEGEGGRRVKGKRDDDDDDDDDDDAVLPSNSMRGALAPCSCRGKVSVLFFLGGGDTKIIIFVILSSRAANARALDNYHHSTIFTKKFKNIITTAYKMGGGLGAFFLCFRTRNQPRADDDRPTDRPTGRFSFLFFFSFAAAKRPILSSLFLLLLLLCARADHFLSLSLSLSFRFNRN